MTGRGAFGAAPYPAAGAGGGGCNPGRGGYACVSPAGAVGGVAVVGGECAAAGCGVSASHGSAGEDAEEARSGGSEVVLSGTGGVGKSQLAASLARDVRDRERSGGRGLDVLVWAKATDPDQIITAYAEAAEQLCLPGVSRDDSAAAARGFLRWLAATERAWLVVLDDVTDPAKVEAWWPDSGARNGWVLATTRREDAQLSGQGRTLIRLGLYTTEEARAYLHRRLTDAGHPPPPRLRPDGRPHHRTRSPPTRARPRRRLPHQQAPHDDRLSRAAA
ncbi:NB-ARC domain-containing protein [Streptomyces sp. GLT-R25]